MRKIINLIIINLILFSCNTTNIDISKEGIVKIYQVDTNKSTISEYHLPHKGPFLNGNNFLDYPYFREYKLGFLTSEYSEEGFQKAQKSIISLEKSNLSDTQKLYTFFSDSSIKEVIPYKDNHVHGKYLKYNKNGRVILESNFQVGKLSGEKIIYYDNGNILMSSDYKDGLKAGTEKIFHRDGTLKVEVTYRDNLKNGSQKNYDRDDNIWWVTNYVDGKEEGLEKWYGLDGRLLKEVFYKDGIESWHKKY